MRGRHNIVGSEVGRPRPPVYMLRTLRLPKRRLARPLVIGGGVLLALMFVLIVAAFVMWA